MKITEINSLKVGDVNSGRIFYCEGEIYFKIHNVRDGSMNALKLVDGTGGYGLYVDSVVRLDESLLVTKVFSISL